MYPGRVTPMKCASSKHRSPSCQDMICASASAPVMKNSSASGRCARRSTQGVDGVRRAAAVDVDPADREPRVGRRRDDRHQVAVLGRADLPVGLLPRLAGGHEDDLVQPEEPCDLARRHQVPVVDRVERAAHDADPPACHGPSVSVPTGAGPGRTGSGATDPRRLPGRARRPGPRRPAPPCSRSQTLAASRRPDGVDAREHRHRAGQRPDRSGVTRQYRKSPLSSRPHRTATATWTARRAERVEASTGRGVDTADVSTVPAPGRHSASRSGRTRLRGW